MLFCIRYQREGNRGVCVMPTQMQYWKSKRDELVGSGMEHYIIIEWWSQSGIKMFQTNITPMHSAGVMYCTIVWCVFARVSEQIRWSDEGVCVSVLGVSAVWVGRLRVCGSSLSLSQGTVGLWVPLLFSSPLYSVSPPSPGSSSTPAPCSRRRAGQGFLSNWRQCEEFM